MASKNRKTEMKKNKKKLNLSLKNSTHNETKIDKSTVTIKISELTDLALDFWRLEKKIMKISNDVKTNESIKFGIDRIKKQLAALQIEIRDHTNEKYSENTNYDVLSIEKNDQNDESLIIETVEPTILHGGQLVNRAKIIISSNN